MWYGGQRAILSRANRMEAPPQSAASYATGFATLVGAYGLQSAFFPHEKETIKTEKKVYVPPKSAGEVFQRVGRPVLMRVGAGSIALFCAGAAQTYVALRNDKDRCKR